jgi:hypothetical protein
MKQESNSAVKDKEQEFKNEVFANNIELYKEMFVDEQVLDEDDIDYIVPGDEDEFKQMMRELSSYGLIED